jgi:hypothetical protein
MYPDVAKAGLDPVRHYLSHGADEGRDPSPFFSTRTYVAGHPELARSRENPLIHFLRRRSVDEREGARQRRGSWDSRQRSAVVHRNELTMLVAFLRAGDQVLDIGDGPKTDTTPFALRVGPEGRVVAVEQSVDAPESLLQPGGPLRLVRIDVGGMELEALRSVLPLIRNRRPLVHVAVARRLLARCGATVGALDLLLRSEQYAFFHNAAGPSDALFHLKRLASLEAGGDAFFCLAVPEELLWKQPITT